MSINYPLLDKSLQKKKNSKIKQTSKKLYTISSSYHPKKIDLDEIYEGILFTSKINSIKNSVVKQ